MVLIILLSGIPIMLAVIFCVYIFYKGIKEKNKIKIIIPLILFVMVRGQIKGIILGILLVLYFLVILFFPYIIGIIISVIAIYLIRKKVKEEKQEILCVTVIVICCITAFILDPLWYKFASERPDDTYVKMKEMDDNKSLIGLSKEQVEELLGEKKDKNKDVYYYDAGKITDYIASDNTFYVFKIYFDENDIVKSTSIKMSD